MSRLLVPVLIVVIGITVSVSQLILRHGVRQISMQTGALSLDTLRSFAVNPYVLVSVVLGLATFLLYSYLLSLAEITFVAPIINAVFYLIIFIVGWLLLREHITSSRIVGAAMLLVAIWLLSWDSP